MKKNAILTCLFVAVLFFTGCNKTKSGEYSGTYSGTLTSANKSKEGVKMTFLNGAVNTDNLFLYGYPLTKESEGVYKIDGTVLIPVIQFIYADITADDIEKADASFTFKDGTVTMTLTYKLLEMVDVTIMKYTGTKE